MVSNISAQKPTHSHHLCEACSSFLEVHAISVRGGHASAVRGTLWKLKTSAKLHLLNLGLTFLNGNGKVNIYYQKLKNWNYKNEKKKHLFVINKDYTYITKYY